MNGEPIELSNCFFEIKGDTINILFKKPQDDPVPVVVYLAEEGFISKEKEYKLNIGIPIN